MHIAILELGVPPRTIGGAEIQAWELARYLTETHRVTLLVRRLPGEAARENRDSVEIRRLRVLGAPFRFVSHVLGYLLQLWRMRHELDAVISFRAYPNGLASALFHRLTRIPCYVSVRGLDWYQVSMSRWGRACLRFALTGHTRVLVQSRTIAGDISRALPQIRKPQVLLNGIERSPHRAKGNAVLFVGGLHRHKGVDVLIEAMRRLGDLPLVIVGDGMERVRLEEQAQGVNVAFLGRVAPGKVCETMATHGRVLVLPTTTSEAFPNVILQAMSVGLPVVASRVPGGVGDLLGDGERGVMVPPNDPPALAEAIRQVFHNDEVRASLIAEAEQYVALHDWGRIVSAWNDLLRFGGRDAGCAARKGTPRLFTAYNMKTRGGAFVIWQRFVQRSGQLGVSLMYATPEPLLAGSTVPGHYLCPCLPGALGNALYMVWLFGLCLVRWWPRRGDVVLSQGILYTLPMLPLRWKGARVVTVVHGDYFEELRRRHVPILVQRLVWLLVEPMYRQSARLLPVSRDLARRLEERHQSDGSRIQVVHNSVPVLSSSSPQVLRELRDSLSLDPHSIVLVYVGGLQPIKRVDRFVQLVSSLSKKHAVQALLVGSGPCRDELEQLARTNEIEELLRFVGWQADPAPYMEVADLLVLCSDYEGCPTVLLEGLALRVPMVGARVGGIPEILGDDRLLFDSEDPADLLQTVTSLLDQNGAVRPWVREHLNGQAERFREPWEEQVVKACFDVSGFTG